MKKALWAIVLSFAAALHAQTTTVTATVTDSQSTAWANAPYSLTFIPSQNIGKPSTTSGQSFTQTYSGTANGSGVISVSGVTDINFIYPANSKWQLCVNPAISSPQTYCAKIAIQGTSEDVSTQINAVIVAPVVTGGLLATAYVDAEVAAVGGNQYFRVSDSTFRCYTTTWGACGGGGSSGFPITIGSTSIASGSTTTSISGLTIDGVSPTTMGFVDATSSIQTQLNGKASSTATFTLGSTSVALGSTVTSVSGLSLVTPALGTPASGVITNLTGTCTACTSNAAAGISTNGTANQVWGMNSGGSAQGWQNATSGITRIAQTVVAGTSTTAVTFSSLSGYSILRLVINGAVSDGAIENANLTVNSDTGTNYYYSSVDGGTWNQHTGTATSLPVAVMASTSASAANETSQAEVLISSYAGTVFNKRIETTFSSYPNDSTLGHYHTWQLSGEWAPTSPAAITSITVTDGGGGHFMAGSTFTIYGMQ